MSPLPVIGEHLRRKVHDGAVHDCRTLQRGSLLIDSSTIDPAVAQDMAKRASDAGAVYMDAPVSGGEWFGIKYSRLVQFDLYCVRLHHELA